MRVAVAIIEVVALLIGPRASSVYQGEILAGSRSSDVGNVANSVITRTPYVFILVQHPYTLMLMKLDEIEYLGYH